MTPFEQIAGVFGTRPVLLRGSESLLDGEWRFSVSPWRLPTERELALPIGQIHSSNSLRLSASVDGSSPMSLASRSDTEVAGFIRELTAYREISSGNDTLELTIRLTKVLTDGSLPLFSLSQLADCLRKRDTKQIFATFEPVCSADAGCCFILYDDVKPFETDSFVFCRIAGPGPTIKRGALTAARKDVCHLEGVPNNLLPEDFHLRIRSSCQPLNDLFDRLCLVMTLGFLCDVSTLSDDGRFSFKLNGYRAISGDLQGQDISTALLGELFKVYQWAYSEGNLADKLGLARNIISLHWKGDVSALPDAGLYESVLSSYAIYLKENVDRYISLKKSLCDYLGEFSQNSAKLAENVGDKLEKNFMAFVGFFISTILLKTVTEKDLGGIFPKPLQIIAWGLVAASFVHGVVSLCFSLRERERVIQDFGLLRKRYEDLLHKSDLDRVLGEDSGFKESIGHLDFKLRLFFGGWVLMLVICSACVVGLTRTMAIQGQKGATKGATPANTSPASLSLAAGKTNATTSLLLAASSQQGVGVTKPGPGTMPVSGKR